MVCTVIKSQSNREPFGCGGAGDLHHRCAADKPSQLWDPAMSIWTWPQRIQAVLKVKKGPTQYYEGGQWVYHEHAQEFLKGCALISYRTFVNRQWCLTVISSYYFKFTLKINVTNSYAFPNIWVKRHGNRLTTSTATCRYITQIMNRAQHFAWQATAQQSKMVIGGFYKAN